MSCPFYVLDELYDYIDCVPSDNKVECPLWEICNNDGGINSVVLETVGKVVYALVKAKEIRDREVYT